MKLQVDATIDLDQNRKIWIQGTAILDEEELDHIPEVIGGLSENVVSKALDAHEQAQVKGIISDPDGEKPQSMRTFED